MLRKYAQLDRRIASEQQTFARPLRSLLRSEPVVCQPTRSIAEAAALMRERQVGSVVVVDAAGQPLGILTSHDLVGATADGVGNEPVAARMTREPISLPAHALAYEAALAMLTRHIRHVLVTDEGRLVGIVSERDLFSLQRLGLGEISLEIRLAQEVSVLARLAADIRKLTGRLVSQGVAADQITSLVTVLNDRLSQRVIELVRKGHDLERVSWCWLAFGSEGRMEQTFSSDQDNGLLFVAHDAAPPPQVRERLLPFARQVNEALDACGFPLCKGNVMASNPELCLSLEEWQAKMRGWIEASTPKALLGAVICFDFRALHGDSTLAAQLREWSGKLTRSHPLFLRHMAQNALKAQPAVGRLGALVTADAGAATGRIDLKQHGTGIFVDVARIYALAHAIPQTGTVERLRAARVAIGMSESEASAAVDAFLAVQAVRLRMQAASTDAAPERQNWLDPAQLGRIESTLLRESLRVARELQERLALDYQL